MSRQRVGWLFVLRPPTSGSGGSGPAARRITSWKSCSAVPRSLSQVRPERARRDPGRQRPADCVPCRLGEEHLPAVRRGLDARGPRWRRRDPRTTRRRRARPSPRGSPSGRGSRLRRATLHRPASRAGHPRPPRTASCGSANTTKNESPSVPISEPRWAAIASRRSRGGASGTGRTRPGCPAPRPAASTPGCR